MEGVRRRQTRKDADYLQSLKLFRELLEAVGGSIRSCYVRDEPKAIEEKEVKIKQQKIGNECKKISKVESTAPEVVRRIELKVGRDWEGLCSERKEDVLGQYAICFEYCIQQREEEKNMDNIVQQESGIAPGGSCSNL